MLEEKRKLLHGLREKTVIKIIQHDTSVETRVMAVDHQPYSGSALGVPNEVADAQRAGLGLHVPDFDARTMEWENVPSAN
jgi:hypothetical protein